MSNISLNGSKTDGEEVEWGGPVLTRVMYEIATIAPNIEVDGKSQKLVIKVVVGFLQNVPLCKEDASRCDHPEGSHTGPCCLLQLGDHSCAFRSHFSESIVVN